MDRLENNLKDEKATKEEEFLSNFLFLVSFIFSVVIGAIQAYVFCTLTMVYIAHKVEHE